jgi:TM2 domain-containing membrane protein YozV
VRYHVGIAYLLWLIGGLGTLGIHRFYLGKPATGVLWIFTGGLGFVGALYDAATLSRQVAEANLRDGFDRGIPVIIQREKEPLERAVLRVAERNQGRVTPVQVAAASDWTIDEVSGRLEAMAKKGLCEMRVSKGGTVVYRFAEFDPSDREFEV